MPSSYTSDSFFCDEGGHFLDNSFSDFTLLYESTTGFCRLFRAKSLGKWFVLKCLKPGKVDDEFCRAMLQKEFSIGYNLSHPAIARTEGLEEVAGLGLCIVMEYVDGISLRECIKRHTMSRAEAFRVADELCSALSYIHGRQIVHRDLKPANIMLTNNGRHVKLVDFGLSDADDFAVFKEPAGTRRYAAPEQFDKEAKVDARADIYALGLILLEIDATLPHRSRRMARVAARCIKGDRDERYATADAVADALRPRPVAVPVIIALLVLLAAVSGYGWWRATVATTADVSWLHDTLAVHRSDTVYINNVETVMQHGVSPIEAFNSDPRMAKINEMARETALRYLQEADSIFGDSTVSIHTKSDVLNSVFLDIEAAVRKQVDEVIAPSLPEHSLYLNAAVSTAQITWRSYDWQHRYW